MKYLLGIDLGTTNTVVYYIDMEEAKAAPKEFKVAQLTAAGECRRLPLLPSCVYLPSAGEFPAGALSLPWDGSPGYIVGSFARECAGKSPDKAILSAKSWLCAGGIDRESPLLPQHSRNPESRISPVEATRRVLEHICDAWNYDMARDKPEARLELQELVLTVPASFDAVARELTVKAAEAAGLRVTLQEEPLAAFYAWLDVRGEHWRRELRVGDLILVCDIGGGTSDFSLVRVNERDGGLELERAAVGRHILLGGDNMDLAAAYTAAATLRKERNLQLDNYQIMGLTQACREAKEALLANPDSPPRQLTVLGRGISVIGGSVSTPVSGAEMRKIVIDGFFPVCSLDDKPAAPVQSGLRGFGLRYEADPAITRHLADFLSRHRAEGVRSVPNKILFNGGVTRSPAIRERLMSVIRQWLEGSGELTELIGNDPDLAVGRGACCYARAMKGEGIRVRAGSSHAYYIGIDPAMPAIPGFTPPTQGLCVVPLGMEEGTGMDIDYDGLGLIVGENAEFRFYSSTERGQDAFGDMLADVEAAGLEESASLGAFLPGHGQTPPGSLIPVRLRSELTATGTLQLWCITPDDDARWKLEFELRSGDGSENAS